jgi:hypothetical protein
VKNEQKEKKRFVYMPVDDIVKFHKLVIARHGGNIGYYPRE